MASRFRRVIGILDSAVGGPTGTVGVHGAFWRNLSRDSFVAAKVFGRDLIVLGNGPASNLVKALRGEAPFGADLPAAPPGALFRRMPAGRPPVSDDDITVIEQWINDGCPEGEETDDRAARVLGVAPEATPGPTWHTTNAPIASSRTDDIWFVNEKVGWAVNSNGHVLKTTDAGVSWVRQLAVGSYLRCVAFANERVGWVGTFSSNRLLFHTVDGGNNWTQVTGLPADAPVKVCGVAVVNEQVVYAAGSNEPLDPPRMMKTIDGGRTWTAWDMRPHASILIDTFFVDERRGFVVGGKADDPSPVDRSEIKPVVLFTEDGGQTWVNRLAGQEADFPFGEWGWKIHFVTPQLGFVSLENFFDAAILKTTDGGKTFTRLLVSDPQGNANLEGVGFIDERTGWVGGWGDASFEGGFSSATVDSGQTWQSANEIGRFINRFRFIGNPIKVGYASGRTVYRYSKEPVPAAPVLHALAGAPSAAPLLAERALKADRVPIEIRINIPTDTLRVAVDVWTRFGLHVGTVFDESRPTAGARTIRWEGRERTGRTIADGEYIVRLTADDRAESATLALTRRRSRGRVRTVRWIPHTVRVARESPVRALAAVPAQPEAETIRIDIPDLRHLTTAVEKAEFLLQSVAEVEHALLVQYLYAAYSLKKPTTVTDPQQKQALRTWSELLLGVAREEMGHLATVQNLLLLLDKLPNFEREDFPQIPNLYPFRMQLEPITRRSLAKYVIAESPFDAQGIADILQEATAGTGGTPPNHVGVLYGLISVLFSEPLPIDEPTPVDPWLRVLGQIQRLAYEQDADPSHWHLAEGDFKPASLSRQVLDREWSPSGGIRIFAPASRDAALLALRDISVQGEGSTEPAADAEGSHFERFLRTYRGDQSTIPFPRDEWSPSLDVPTNPKLDGDSADGNVIHSAKAKALARLADLRYALLLGFLEQHVLLEPPQRAFLVDWCFAEMGTLQMLSDKLTTLPRGATPGVVAALPFTLPDTISISGEQPARRWQLHGERLTAAIALAQEIVDLHSADDPALRNRLTKLKTDDGVKLQRVQAAAQGDLPSVTLGRWEEVRRILSAAMGFSMSAPHGRFWEKPLDQFVQGSFANVRFVADPGPDRGKRSGLVQALRGVEPFDGNPFMRMPRRRAPVADDLIDVIERWIDDGCPEV